MNGESVANSYKDMQAAYKVYTEALNAHIAMLTAYRQHLADSGLKVGDHVGVFYSFNRDGDPVFRFAFDNGCILSVVVEVYYYTGDLDYGILVLGSGGKDLTSEVSDDLDIIFDNVAESDLSRVVDFVKSL